MTTRWTPWDEEQTRFVAETGEKLLTFAKQIFTRGTVTDVVVWSRLDREHDEFRLHVLYWALVGDGLKFARQTGMLLADEEEGGLRGATLDSALSRAFGTRVEMFRWDPHVMAFDFLDRLSSAVGQAAERPDDFEEQSFTFIPEPGYPWPQDPRKSVEGFRYWSTRKGGFVTPERPGWLMALPDSVSDHASRWGVNPCRVFPPDDSRTDPSGPVMGRLGNQEVMVAHAMQLRTGAGGWHKLLDSAIRGVKDCGGLLFPSLSVGPVPATNFGPIVMVANLELVLNGLRPYRKRGVNPVWVYETDAWTITTGVLMGEVAGRLFEELHGHEDYLTGSMWTIGPPPTVFGGPAELSDPIDTTKKLGTSIKQRMRRWKRGMSAAQIAALSDHGPDAKYAYCEAKAREVVALASFPYLIAPDSLREPVELFVKGVGYQGEVIYLPDDLGVGAHVDSDREAELWEWSWRVADVVRDLRPIVEI